MLNSNNTSAYISLGSNLGDRSANLLLGIRGIMDGGLPIKRLSHIYESEPVETFSQPYFLNMVAELGPENLLQPEQVMARLLRVEYSLGRRREIAKGPRVIDLDLLLVGAQTNNSELLILPHPRMHLRRFVLLPLVELAPNLVHPILRVTLESLLENLEDQSNVVRWLPGHGDGETRRWGEGE